MEDEDKDRLEEEQEEDEKSGELDMKETTIRFFESLQIYPCKTCHIRKKDR